MNAIACGNSGSSRQCFRRLTFLLFLVSATVGCGMGGSSTTFILREGKRYCSTPPMPKLPPGSWNSRRCGYTLGLDYFLAKEYPERLVAAITGGRAECDNDPTPVIFIDFKMKQLSQGSVRGRPWAGWEEVKRPLSERDIRDGTEPSKIRIDAYDEAILKAPLRRFYDEAKSLMSGRVFVTATYSKNKKVVEIWSLTYPKDQKNAIEYGTTIVEIFRLADRKRLVHGEYRNQMIDAATMVGPSALPSDSEYFLQLEDGSFNTLVCVFPSEGGE